MIKNIKSVGVLVAICSIIALLLALTNQITAPIIEQRKNAAANEALAELFPTAEGFKEMDLSQFSNLPASVKEAYRETSGQGYVIKLNFKAYKEGMVLMCGITPNGVITAIKFLETNDDRKSEAASYGDNFIGKTIDTYNEVDTIANSTITTTGYKNGIKDALQAVAIFGGEVVDTRTDEEKAMDQLEETLQPTEEVKLSEYEDLPTSITKIMKGAKGYIVYLTVEGYKPGMEIVCGVTTDGKVVNTLCLTSNETMGKEKTYGANFVGKDLAGVEEVDTIAKSTMTSSAYKNAVKDAINASIILGGGEADLRTEEEKFNDNLKAALPEADAFIKRAIAGADNAIDFIYAAQNGAGYVYVLDKTFVGVNAEGTVVSEGINADTAALAQQKAALAAAHVVIDTTDSGINSNITSVQKNAEGNYVIEINGLGFGWFGDEAHYQLGKNIPIQICTVISPDGVMLECLTVSHQESGGYGAVCGDEAYYGQFDGKTLENYKEVDGIAGATITTDGYMKAIERCFKAVAILEGGAA